MVSYQQNAVSKAVWPWTVAQNAQPQNIPSKQMAFVGFLVASSIAALIFFKKPDHRVFSYVIQGIASFILLSALFCPPAYIAIHRGLSAFGRWVGLVMSYLLLVPFFFLVFPFMRFLQLVSGKDPLSRKFPADAQSCWRDRTTTTDREYLTRQG